MTYQRTKNFTSPNHYLKLFVTPILPFAIPSTHLPIYTSTCLLDEKPLLLRAHSFGFSGRKIVEILEKNPKKDPSKYEEDDVAHMRKVVAYNKRHLAQEGKAKQDPDSKSAKSLKNWGHDPQKA